MSEAEPTGGIAHLSKLLTVEARNPVELKLEAGPEPWTWLFSLMLDGDPIAQDLSRRHLQMADLDVMLQGDFVDRSISGGGILLLRKVNAAIRFRIVAPEPPFYCPANGHLGDVSWTQVLEAVNDLERKRKGTSAFPTLL